MRPRSRRQFFASIRRVAALLALLAVVLMATGTQPIEEHHASPQAELSRLASPFVSDVIPHDPAILPQVLLWMVHLPIHPARIEAFTTTFAFLCEQGHSPRAPPMT